MKTVSIDLSILSDSATFCKVSGNISVPEIPQVGDKIYFPLSNEYWNIFDNDDYVSQVSQPFTVESRIIIANGHQSSIVIVMRDIVVSSGRDANNFGKYFEKAHKLVHDFDDQ